MLTRPASKDSYLACIRPEQIEVTPSETGAAVVRSISFLGNLRRLEVESPAGPLLVETHGGSPYYPGDRVELSIAPKACTWVVDDTAGTEAVSA